MMMDFPNMLCARTTKRRTDGIEIEIEIECLLWSCLVIHRLAHSREKRLQNTIRHQQVLSNWIETAKTRAHFVSISAMPNHIALSTTRLRDLDRPAQVPAFCPRGLSPSLPPSLISRNASGEFGWIRYHASLHEY